MALCFLQKQYSALTWNQVVDIADQCLYAAKKTQRNAWVGVFGSDDARSGDFLQRLNKDPQSLLNASEMRLETSISKDKVLIWS